MPPAQQVAAQEHSLGSHSQTPVAQQPQSQHSQPSLPLQAQVPAQAAALAAVRLTALSTVWTVLSDEQQAAAFPAAAEHEAAATPLSLEQQADVFVDVALTSAAQQAAVQSSQQSQLQAAGSQAQTPVAQQPQQSQGTLQAQGLLADITPATASAPVVTSANREPIINLNMDLTPIQKE